MCVRNVDMLAYGASAAAAPSCSHKHTHTHAHTHTRHVPLPRSLQVHGRGRHDGRRAVARRVARRGAGHSAQAGVRGAQRLNTRGDGEERGREGEGGGRGPACGARAFRPSRPPSLYSSPHTQAARRRAVTELLFFASVGDIKRVERIAKLWKLDVREREGGEGGGLI